jgi:hypothetical protein
MRGGIVTIAVLLVVLARRDVGVQQALLMPVDQGGEVLRNAGGVVQCDDGGLHVRAAAAAG